LAAAAIASSALLATKRVTNVFQDSTTFKSYAFFPFFQLDLPVFQLLFTSCDSLVDFSPQNKNNFIKK